VCGSIRGDRSDEVSIIEDEWRVRIDDCSTIGVQWRVWIDQGDRGDEVSIMGDEWRTWRVCIDQG
jgi:phage terminase large subunit-like protein